MGLFIFIFGMQIVGKLLLLRFKPNTEVFKVQETQISLDELFDSYHRQFALVQNHNDSILHNFKINVNETTSTITISSSIVTTSARNTSAVSMHISSVKIRMANLSNADLTLSTQFVSNLINSSNAIERHQELTEL